MSADRGKHGGVVSTEPHHGVPLAPVPRPVAGVGGHNPHQLCGGQNLKQDTFVGKYQPNNEVLTFIQVLSRPLVAIVLTLEPEGAGSGLIRGGGPRP